MIGYAVGIGGLVLGIVVAVVNQWFAARERRRARPIVITHEVSKRHFRDGTKYQVASVYLTNESPASAFNIRFGINMAGINVPWRYEPADKEPSRINVLQPHGRWPREGTIDIVIPDDVLWAIGTERNPDEGRTYWSYYHSPAGEWWHTVNPELRSANLTIEPIGEREKAKHDRELAGRVQEGKEALSDAIRDLKEGAKPEPPTRGGWAWVAEQSKKMTDT